MSERDCSFACQTSPKALSLPDTSAAEQTSSLNDDRSHDDIVPTLDTIVDGISSLSRNSSECSSVDHQIPSLDEGININHIELLVHVILSDDMFSIGPGKDVYTNGLSLLLRSILDCPYLLHQLLAFSARHLASIHPVRSNFYLQQAISLQTRAISFFNAAKAEVTQSNCVNILLFSSVLGHHLLADTIAKRDPGGLIPFMSHYIQCLELHRGIHSIAVTAWPLLMKSELEPILSWSSGFSARPAIGDHCQRVQSLVENAGGLLKEEKEACQRAIHYLQVGLDAILSEANEQQAGRFGRYQMIFSWMLLAPPEFTTLLASHRPEALSLLAYYAVILHHGRNLWQVGDAGAYLLSILVDYLGPDWNQWLEYPRRVITGDI